MVYEGQEPAPPIQDLRPLRKPPSQPESLCLLQGRAEGPGVGPSCRIRGAQGTRHWTLGRHCPTTGAPSADALLANLDRPTQNRQSLPRGGGRGGDARARRGRGGARSQSELVNYRVRERMRVSPRPGGGGARAPSNWRGGGSDMPRRNPSTGLRPQPGAPAGVEDCSGGGVLFLSR